MGLVRCSERGFDGPVDSAVSAAGVGTQKLSDDEPKAEGDDMARVGQRFEV